MLVTSDIFDFNSIPRFRDINWRENLLCGIAFHGAGGSDYRAGATFLVEAAKRRRLLSEMKWASYNKPGEKQARYVTCKSFLRLPAAELVGARDAEGLLLRGVREADGAPNDCVIFGGVFRCQQEMLTTAQSGERLFDGDFLFPLTSPPNEDAAADLLRLAVECLAAEYGYFFIRDEMCFPMGYAWGVAPALDYKRTSNREAEEIGQWRDYTRAGQIWTDEWPRMRDLYEVNLISERHTSSPSPVLAICSIGSTPSPAAADWRTLARGAGSGYSPMRRFSKPGRRCSRPGCCSPTRSASTATWVDFVQPPFQKESAGRNTEPHSHSIVPGGFEVTS